MGFWFRDLRKWWHLRGRREVNGRRLRYDLCTDIPLTVLAMLKEFRADCGSSYFHCYHEGDLAMLTPLIVEGEQIAIGDYNDNVWESEVEAWADWVKRVADILPRLWD